MKQLSLHGAEDARWEDTAIPEPGGGQVLLKVKFVGVCGSDLHYYFHGANGEYTITEPLVPGHELSAIVEHDPSGTLAQGTPVTVHPARFGPAQVGLEHHPHLRPGGDYLGSAATTPHRQGAAAEYMVVESQMVRMLPAGLSLERAALAEPLAVALHAVSLAGSLAGKRVLVTGAGPIGLLVIAAARHAGATDISASDVQSAALARAESVGAGHTYLASDGSLPTEAFDVVFECSGAAPALSQAIQSAVRAGIVVQVGMLPNTPVNVNLAPLLGKELTIYGAFRFIDEIDEAISLLVADPTLDQVITHIVDASDATKAFEIARDSARSAKVLLRL